MHAYHTSSFEEIKYLTYLRLLNMYTGLVKSPDFFKKKFETNKWHFVLSFLSSSLNNSFNTYIHLNQLKHVASLYFLD